jgi:hypothetical protein
MVWKLSMVLGGTIAAALLGVTTFSKAEPPRPPPAPLVVSQPPREQPPREQPPTEVAKRTTTIVTGALYHTTRGPLTLSVPPELALTAGSVDLVIHFHGTPKCQETNLRESGLKAIVVSVNEGVGSAAYLRYRQPGMLDRLVAFAEKELAASGRTEGAHVKVGRIAISSWSAGGAATQAVLTRDAERVDAVLVADGIFSTYSDRQRHQVDPRPLSAVVEYARRAQTGERLFVLTHTDIIPTEYPNVEECTGLLLSSLGLEKGAPTSTTATPSPGVALYGVTHGGLRITGFAGKRTADHAAQLYALDDAYGQLRARWGH